MTKNNKTIKTVRFADQHGLISLPDFEQFAKANNIDIEKMKNRKLPDLEEYKKEKAKPLQIDTTSKEATKAVLDGTEEDSEVVLIMRDKNFINKTTPTSNNHQQNTRY